MLAHLAQAMVLSCLPVASLGSMLNPIYMATDSALGAHYMPSLCRRVRNQFLLGAAQAQQSGNKTRMVNKNR